MKLYEINRLNALTYVGKTILEPAKRVLVGGRETDFSKIFRLNLVGAGLFFVEKKTNTYNYTQTPETIAIGAPSSHTVEFWQEKRINGSLEYLPQNSVNNWAEITKLQIVEIVGELIIVKIKETSTARWRDLIDTPLGLDFNLLLAAINLANNQPAFSSNKVTILEVVNNYETTANKRGFLVPGTYYPIITESGANTGVLSTKNTIVIAPNDNLTNVESHVGQKMDWNKEAILEGNFFNASELAPTGSYVRVDINNKAYFYKYADSTDTAVLNKSAAPTESSFFEQNKTLVLVGSILLFGAASYFIYQKFIK